MKVMSDTLQMERNILGLTVIILKNVSFKLKFSGQKNKGNSEH